jgi:hypothetical protein
MAEAGKAIGTRGQRGPGLCVPELVFDMVNCAGSH